MLHVIPSPESVLAIGALILRVLGILIHEPPDVKLQRLAVDNDGLHVHQKVQHARRLGRRRVAPLVHGGTIDGHVAGHHDTLLAAAQRELHLALAHGADDAADGAVELGLGAGGEVDHADYAAIGVVEGWLGLWLEYILETECLAQINDGLRRVTSGDLRCS